MKKRVVYRFLAFAVVFYALSNVHGMPVKKISGTGVSVANEADMPTLAGDTDEYFEALGISYGSKARMGELHMMALTNAQNIIRQKMAHVYKGVIEDYIRAYGNNLGTDIETKMERKGKQFMDAILNDTREVGSPEFSEMDEKGNITCYVVARMYKKGLAGKMSDFVLKSEELKGKIEEAPFKRIIDKHFETGQPVSSVKRPVWLDGFFQEAGCSYVEKVSAVGNSEKEARNQAGRIVIERRLNVTGLDVEIRGDSIVVLNSTLTVKSRVIDEFIEQTPDGRVRVNLLVQTAKHPECQYEWVWLSDRYPFSPRVFLPGMEQIYKGSKTKGALFITGEIVAAGGIVAFENLRVSKRSEFNRTHDVAARRKYSDDADKMRNLRNGFIAGAAAVYLWNIIDGCVAKGEERVWIKKTKMRVAPQITPQSAGMAWVLNF